MNRALKKTGAVLPVALGSRNGLWSIDVPAQLEEVLSDGYLDDLSDQVLAGDRLMLNTGVEGARTYADAVVIEAVERKEGEPGRVVLHLLSSTRPVKK